MTRGRHHGDTARCIPRGRVLDTARRRPGCPWRRHAGGGRDKRATRPCAPENGPEAVVVAHGRLVHDVCELVQQDVLNRAVGAAGAHAPPAVGEQVAPGVTDAHEDAPLVEGVRAGARGVDVHIPQTRDAGSQQGDVALEVAIVRHPGQGTTCMWGGALEHGLRRQPGPPFFWRDRPAQVVVPRDFVSPPLHRPMPLLSRILREMEPGGSAAQIAESCPVLCCIPNAGQPVILGIVGYTLVGSSAYLPDGGGGDVDAVLLAQSGQSAFEPDECGLPRNHEPEVALPPRPAHGRASLIARLLSALRQSTRLDAGRCLSRTPGPGTSCFGRGRSGGTTPCAVRAGGGVSAQGRRGQRIPGRDVRPVDGCARGNGRAPGPRAARRRWARARPPPCPSCRRIASSCCWPTAPPRGPWIACCSPTASPRRSGCPPERARSRPRTWLRTVAFPQTRFPAQIPFGFS
jgi:hypothetical protein